MYNFVTSSVWTSCGTWLWPLRDGQNSTGWWLKCPCLIPISISCMSPAPEGTCTVSQNMPPRLTVSMALGRCSSDFKCTVKSLLQLHLHYQLIPWLQWIGQRQLQNEAGNIQVFGSGATYTRGLIVIWTLNISSFQLWIIFSFTRWHYSKWQIKSLHITEFKQLKNYKFM